MRFYQKVESCAIGSTTVSHNLNAFEYDAVFGMGSRMGLLLHPISCLLRNVVNPKVLIVGPRTEDDIFWAKSLGLNDSIGLDLFSYSKYIELGDIHETAFDENKFDAIILGWVISYSSRPAELIDECLRIVKNKGFIGFGIESNPDYRCNKELIPPRVNALNSCKDIASIFDADIVFIHDPELNKPTDNTIIFKIKK